MSEIETWRAVVGFEGFYEVSDLGRVRSLDRVIEQIRRGCIVRFPVRGRILASGSHPSGHHSVVLWVNGEKCTRCVHRLVLEAFVGPRPDGKECRHLNGVPSDNRLANLVWGTRRENFNDRTRLGEWNQPRGEVHHKSKLNEQDVRFIREQVGRGRDCASIGRQLGVRRQVVWRVARGQNWGWLK